MHDASPLLAHSLASSLALLSDIYIRLHSFLSVSFVHFVTTCVCLSAQSVSTQLLLRHLVFIMTSKKIAYWDNVKIPNGNVSYSFHFQYSVQNNSRVLVDNQKPIDLSHYKDPVVVHKINRTRNKFEENLEFARGVVEKRLYKETPTKILVHESIANQTNQSISKTTTIYLKKQ